MSKSHRAQVKVSEPDREAMGGQLTPHILVADLDELVRRQLERLLVGMRYGLMV